MAEKKESTVQCCCEQRGGGGGDVVIQSVSYHKVSEKVSKRVSSRKCAVNEGMSSFAKFCSVTSAVGDKQA